MGSHHYEQISRIEIRNSVKVVTRYVFGSTENVSDPGLDKGAMLHAPATAANSVQV